MRKKIMIALLSATMIGGVVVAVAASERRTGHNDREEVAVQGCSCSIRKTGGHCGWPF